MLKKHDQRDTAESIAWHTYGLRFLIIVIQVVLRQIIITAIRLGCGVRVHQHILFAVPAQVSASPSKSAHRNSIDTHSTQASSSSPPSSASSPSAPFPIWFAASCARSSSIRASSSSMRASALTRPSSFSSRLYFWGCCAATPRLTLYYARSINLSSAIGIQAD